MRERVREEDGVRSVGKCGGKNKTHHIIKHHHTTHITHDTSQTKRQKQQTNNIQSRSLAHTKQNKRGTKGGGRGVEGVSLGVEMGNVWWLRDEKMRESGRKERKPHKTKTHITSHSEEGWRWRSVEGGGKNKRREREEGEMGGKERKKSC